MKFEIEGIPPEQKSRVVRSLAMWQSMPDIVAWAGFWTFWCIVAWQCGGTQ